MTKQLDAVDFLLPFIEKAKEQKRTELSSSIWNIYRFKYMERQLKKLGYTVSLNKRLENDVHYFTIGWKL
jgi:uncharacterized UBP type Zn finger protein